MEPDPDQVNYRIAHITDDDGNVYQVVRYEPDPETGEPVAKDWDEQATAEEIASHDEQERAESPLETALDDVADALNDDMKGL